MYNLALMKKSVDIYISELLFLHDCVIIPEFGGFVGNNKSATLNAISGTIYPPSNIIINVDFPYKENTVASGERTIYFY